MNRRQWIVAAIFAVILGTVAAFFAGLMDNPPEKPISGPPPGVALKPAFADEFEGTTLYAKRWLFAYYDPARDKPTISRRNLYTNAERQVYMDRDFLGLGIDPFQMKAGILTIAARPLSDAEKAIIATAVSKQPPKIANSPLRNVAYSSGMISSRGTFSQTYGYFEIRARWSSGKGIWPAFWLLPATGGWPPEIDVIEAHGDKPGITYHTLHSPHGTLGAHEVRAPADDGHFHTYGMLWQPDRIQWYVDDQLTASEPTPKDMHQPMFVIANLAIGGKWPGDPDADTPFPAQMEIDYIRAWSLDRPTAP